MVTKIIGLAGKSGSGKDAVANYLGEQYNYTKIAVADAIRDEIADFLYEKFSDIGMPEKALNEVASMVWEKPTTHSIRVLLQWWGVNRCSQDSGYWVNILKDEMTKYDLIVVSDVRLPIEMDAIHEAGGEVWCVERPGAVPVGIPGHITEVGLEGATFDRIITNDKSLTDLKAKVDFIFCKD